MHQPCIRPARTERSAKHAHSHAYLQRRHAFGSAADVSSPPAQQLPMPNASLRSPYTEGRRVARRLDIHMNDSCVRLTQGGRGTGKKGVV